MRSFLSLLAQNLYERYGDEISSLSVILPNRRARLFFTAELADLIDKPLWQPRFLTVDELMEQYASLRKGEKIALLADLYKVYGSFHKETFDSFYYWGEMLLSDFDSIDKYMVDAGMIFRNIAQLKEIGEDNSYLSGEQTEIISRFWKSFGHESGYSDEKRKFIDIWNTLHPIYLKYRENLAAQGTGYGGMIYRQAAENIKNGDLPKEHRGPWVIAGFNALTQCEKILFKHLAAVGSAEFYWDTDDYYTGDTGQEAGLFVRENMRMFPQRYPLGSTNNFRRSRTVTVAASPSDSLQCKYAGSVLGQLCSEGHIPAKDTAIVLTDENLLVPLLSSIPEEVSEINVTMGYPLKLTPAYTLFERLSELQGRKKRKAGKTLFRYGDLTGLLGHPYVCRADPAACRSLTDRIKKSRLFYPDISPADISGSILGELLCDCGDSWEELDEYLLCSFSAILSAGSLSGEENGGDRDQLALLADNVRRTVNSLTKTGLEISPKVFISLLRKVLQGISIPYEGEPLKGVQVMGILETRNLDFRNVVILSASDDNFPGNRVSSFSFIPHNLRYAYGLPTPAHHEGVYAYYFYRLLQRAENIHIVYSSRSDEKSSGEQSRYIYQLLYESPHDVVRKDIGLDINLEGAREIAVEKTGDAALLLERFLAGEKPLSPSAFNAYVCCPLKFYFQVIAGLRPEEEPEEQVDAPMFGTLLHRAMDLLYRPLCGADDPRPAIKSLISGAEVEQAVHLAVSEEFLRGEKVPVEDYGGNLALAADIICRYINKCILPFDAGGRLFTILRTEHEVGTAFVFDKDGGRQVRLRGNADRIDRLEDGKFRVVDYKTGREQTVFNGVEALFSPLSKDRNAAALQTMLYGLMLSHAGTTDVQPALYYVRNLNSPDYSPLLKDRSTGSQVGSYGDYASKFEELFSAQLFQLFDLDRPFSRCEDVKTCMWCDFRNICGR